MGTLNLFREAGLQPNVVRASARYLPFRDASFDCVYSFGVIHHIPEVDEVIDGAQRVLRHGGEMILMVYNRESLLYAYSILFAHRDEGLNEDQLVSRYSERILGCPYTRVYTKDELKGMLQQSFDPIAFSVHYDVIDLPDQRKFKLNTPDRYELGWHLMVSARRR